MSASRTKHLPWNEQTVYAFGFHRRLSHLLGFWPFTCDELGSKIRFLIVVVSQVTLCYDLIKEITNGCISVTDKMQNIGVVLTTVCVLVKILLIRANHKKMFFIFGSAVKDWSIVLDNEPRKIMRRYAYIGRTVPIITWNIGCLSVLAQTVLNPPTLRDYTNEYILNLSNFSTPKWRNLPMTTGCSVVDLSTFMYLVFYCIQVIQTAYVVSCLAIPDGLFFASAMHLCGQLELLNICMAQLGRRPKEEEEEEEEEEDVSFFIKEETIRNEIVTLIRRHNHLYRDMNLLEDAFNIMILCQQAMTFFTITIMGVQILYNLQIGEYVVNGPWISGIVNLLGQLYIYNYGGECLTSLTTNIRMAAYSSAWYNFSPSLAKSLLLVMVRLERTFYLTAGKLYIIHKESYTTMLKTMFSFFSVLKLTIVD